MHVVIQAGDNNELLDKKKPQTFLNLAGKDLFSNILKQLEGQEVIVVTPFPDYFKNY